MKKLAAVICSAFLLIVSAECQANCVNTFNASCGFYESCFEKYCPCKNTEHSYAIDYGQKYCKRFLGLQGLSMFGVKWRDSTLKCLQETVVPELDLNNPQLCNCKQMKSFSMQSHVACYTKQPNSICFLTEQDHNKISLIIDNKDLFDSAGWQTMLDISKECVRQLGVNSAASAGWKLIKLKIEKYVNE